MMIALLFLGFVDIHGDFLSTQCGCSNTQEPTLCCRSARTQSSLIDKRIRTVDQLFSAMDSIYDTSFMVLAAGTAAAGAVLSYISYYVWGRPAEAAAPAPAPAPEETSPSTDLRDEAPTKAPEFEQEPPSPRGKEKISSESSGGLLAIPSGGSAILVSPIKERPRAPARTLPSRGHLKARPAIDPRSEFQKQLDEQATSAQQRTPTLLYASIRANVNVLFSCLVVHQ